MRINNFSPLTYDEVCLLQERQSRAGIFSPFTADEVRAMREDQQRRLKVIEDQELKWVEERRSDPRSLLRERKQTEELPAYRPLTLEDLQRNIQRPDNHGWFWTLTTKLAQFGNWIMRKLHLR